MHNTGQRSNPPAIKFMLISRAWGFPSDALEARVGEPLSLRPLTKKLSR